MVYSAKGLASILAGYGAALVAAYFLGSFIVPFYIAAAFCAVSAALSFFALRPVIRGRIAKEVTAPQPALSK
jgi:membrane protein implicated in regulation of membrane protease activity